MATITQQPISTPSAWHPASASMTSPAMTTEQTPMTVAQANQTLLSAPKDSATSGYERRVSSTILEEEYLEKFEGDSVRYIEVTEVIEVPKYVTKKSQQIVEKRVPKYEVEYVEKLVEVPQIKYVDKYVEVPQVQEVIKHVPKKEIVNVNTEVIKHVPKYETRTVEKVVEVPGEVIEVEKRFVVENKVIIPQIVDKQVPVVIAQSVHPHLRDSPDEVVDIDVVEHTPQVIEVEVQVPKPVGARIWAAGAGKSFHRVVKDVPAAQYNSLLKLMNPHLQTQQERDALPFMRDNDGTVQMLNANERVPYVELPADVKLVDDAGMEVHASRGVTNEFSSQVQDPFQKSGSNTMYANAASGQFASRGIAQQGSGIQSRSVPFNEDLGAQAASVTSSQVDSKGNKRYSSKRDAPSVSHYGPPSTARKGTNTSRLTVSKKSRACAC